MRLEVALAVAWAACSTSALSISHWDLEGGNRTCEGRESCADVTVEPSGPELWMERNCRCDDKCATYGDCCPDSPHFELQQQRRGVASFQCVDLRQYGGIYMRSTCPPEWSEPNIRAACETASENIMDPIPGTPATDLLSGITYRNLFCAICHGAEDLDIWHPRIECHGIPSKMTQDTGELLYFNEKKEDWGIDFEGRFYSCAIDPTPPNITDTLIRRCIPDMVKSCAVNWTNAEVRTRCEAYTSIVYLGDNVYRNPHCGVCNNAQVHLLQCTKLSFRGTFEKHFSLSAFSVLFDLSGGPPGMTQPCDEDQLYDPFYKKCRNVLQEFQQTPRSIGKTYFTDIENATTANFTAPFLKCKKFILHQDDYTIDNNIVYVSKYRKRFREDEFLIYEDGRLEICADNIGVKLVEKFDPYMGYITFAGLGVSIIFILLHLIAFSLVPDLRNLSGKNMASLCVALLVAYISFVAGRFFQGDTCLFVAVLTFYSFLASFTWMLTMSFDVWRTLRLATSELRVCSGKQWRKFIAYSLCSWLVPVLVVMMALWTELSPGVGADWRPGFTAANSCWFGHSKPLLIFFAVPLAIVMVLNIIFFGSSAHMVYSSSSTTRFTASASTQRDFRLYLRLAVVMGLTWTTGLIAGALDFDLLWYLFILLNTLQGLFIFLAFTCNDKVIRHLTDRRKRKPEVIPRSFSWSTDSSVKKSQVDSENTFDTLY